jgi:hypothetical protein
VEFAPATDNMDAVSGHAMRTFLHRPGALASKTATALVALSLAACAARTIRLPDEQGTLALTETVRVYSEVAQRCTGVNGWTAEMTISGAIDGRHVRARLLAAFSPPIVRLESFTRSGDRSLVFVSQGDRAVVRVAGSQTLQAADPRDVMNAIIGVPMAADFFGRTLAACEFPTGSRAMRMIGSQWARFPLAGGSVYVHRASASESWRLVTIFYPGETLDWSWRIDYHDVIDGFPLRAHLISADRRVDLQFRLAHVDTMFVHRSDDARFQVDMPTNPQRLQPKQLRQLIYGGRE